MAEISQQLMDCHEICAESFAESSFSAGVKYVALGPERAHQIAQFVSQEGLGKCDRFRGGNNVWSFYCILDSVMQVTF